MSTGLSKGDPGLWSGKHGLTRLAPGLYSGAEGFQVPQTVVEGPTGLALDPTFNSVPNLVYAPGDRTVTRTSALGGRLGLRGQNANSTGKQYFEMEAISANLFFVGIVDFTFTTNGTGGPVGTNRVGLQQGQIQSYNGVSTPMGGQAAPGIIMRVAWDADNDLFWIARGAAAPWNNNVAADPVAGIGGLSTGGLAGPAYVGVVLRQQAGAGVVCRVPGDPGYNLLPGFVPWS